MNLLEKELECQNTIWDYILRVHESDNLRSMILEMQKKLDRLKKQQIALSDHTFLLMKLVLDSDSRFSEEELNWFSDIVSLNRLINTSLRPQVNQVSIVLRFSIGV